MLKIIFWVSALAILTFTIVNHAPIDVSLWPFDYEITAPLSIFIYISFVLGFFMGFLSKSLKNLLTKQTS